MKRAFRPSAFYVLTAGVALIILIGALLLSLPFATRDGSIPFLDAIFTSVSASCVTGLAVYDTYTKFTFFGQAVLLALIQLGGLGFMMVASLVSLMVGRRIGLYERSLLMESIGALNIGGVVRLTRRALLGTAFFEGCGALLLSLWFCPRFGFWQGLWMSVFHSVSAFCNAGFDLLGIRAPGTSLITAADAPLVNFVIIALILIGGLGFIVWDDLYTKRLNFRRYSLHTKIVLSVTLILTVGGTAAFFLLERNAAFAGLPVGQQLLMAAFQAVTPRTAGFCTVDLTSLSEGGILLTIILMFVGAGSGSTGGGVKMTTFAVLVLNIAAYVRRRPSVNVFDRRIDDATIHKAASSAGMFLAVGLAGCMVLCVQGVPLTAALFESVSAIGTAGLSLGITSSLPAISKVTVMLLMFAGRLGSLSVAMALTRKATPRQQHIRNVTERIMIG